MTKSTIAENIFIKNYASMFSLSQKAKNVAIVYILFVLFLLALCVYFRQYLAIVFISINGYKYVDKKWIKGKRHAIKRLKTNGIFTDLEFELTQDVVLINIFDCLFGINWNSFSLFIESDDVIYFEHKIGHKFMIMKEAIDKDQWEIYHPKMLAINAK